MPRVPRERDPKKNRHGRRGCRHVAALLATGDEADAFWATDFPGRFVHSTAQLEQDVRSEDEPPPPPPPRKPRRRRAAAVVACLLAAVKLSEVLDRWRWWGRAKAGARLWWRVGHRRDLALELLGAEKDEEEEWGPPMGSGGAYTPL